MNTPPSHPPRARSRGGRRTALLGLLVMTPIVLTACGSAVAPAGDDAPESHGEAVTIDNCGRELTFAHAPEAVVGLMPSQTDLLLRLGAQDQLAGQAQVATSELPADVASLAADVPVLSTDAPPAREDLLSVAPDLVVSPTEYEFTAEQGFASIEQLADNGAQAYVATGGCAERRSSAEVTDLLTDIENLGKILRAEDLAADLAADAQARLDAVTEAVRDQEPLTVAEIWSEGNMLGAIGAGIEYDIIRTAGGDNVFNPDGPEFADFFSAEITPEEIVSRNPDAIVFGVTSDAQHERVVEYLRATFPDVTAVQNDLLIAVPQSDFYPGTIGNIDAVETIAHQLYPDAF
ncbi:ABC transporter substrate-binding protein [Microbacterium sp. 2216-1]|uniref:ABC transporter substrate-binding protein n=1 Tax=Microbacterium sp. 2216-1 TaxID=3390053 RepID=UPI0039751C4A